jgi:hypothetical protein
MDFSSQWTVIASFPIVLLQFLVAPLLPFRPDSALDIAAAGDGLIRIALLLLAISRVRRAKGQQKLVLGFLLGAYLAYCVLLAAGTGNAGTALRHQIKASWLLVIVGGPPFAAWIFGQLPGSRRFAKRNDLGNQI